MPLSRDDPAYAGQKDYTPWFLKIYDPLVLGFLAKAVWRFPTDHLVQTYIRYLGRRHLDVGPGTGYFLKQAGISDGACLTLVDPNANVLDHVARRLAPLPVRLIEADVLKDLVGELGSQRYNSAALSLVLHCLPGPASRKASAIKHVAAVLEPDGVLFGASVLGIAERHTIPARFLLRLNNRMGAFDNLTDTEEELRQILGESFDEVDVEVLGSIAVFSARKPRQLRNLF